MALAKNWLGKSKSEADFKPSKDSEKTVDGQAQVASVSQALKRFFARPRRSSKIRTQTEEEGKPEERPTDSVSSSPSNNKRSLDKLENQETSSTVTHDMEYYRQCEVAYMAMLYGDKGSEPVVFSTSPEAAADSVSGVTRNPCRYSDPIEIKAAFPGPAKKKIMLTPSIPSYLASDGSCREMAILTAAFDGDENRTGQSKAVGWVPTSDFEHDRGKEEDDLDLKSVYQAEHRRHHAMISLRHSDPGADPSSRKNLEDFRSFCSFCKALETKSMEKENKRPSSKRNRPNMVNIGDLDLFTESLEKAAAHADKEWKKQQTEAKQGRRVSFHSSALTLNGTMIRIDA